MRDRCEVGGQDVSALKIADHGLHLAARDAGRSRARARGSRGRASSGRPGSRPDTRRGAIRVTMSSAAGDAPGEQRAQLPAPRRLGRRARRKFFSAGALTLIACPRCRPSAARRCRIASRMRSPVPAIDPAPSVMTRSPGRTMLATAAGTSSSGRDDAHAAARRVAHRRGQRVERHTGNRRLTGRVDVGQHDLVGSAQCRAELAHQLAGAGVAMRLEHDDDAPIDAGARPRRGRRRSRSDDGRSRPPP